MQAERRVAHTGKQEVICLGYSIKETVCDYIMKIHQCKSAKLVLLRRSWGEGQQRYADGKMQQWAILNGVEHLGE